MPSWSDLGITTYQVNGLKEKWSKAAFSHFTIEGFKVEINLKKKKISFLNQDCYVYN